MANISHGMNVVEIEALGNKIQNQHCSNIDQLIREVQSLVDNTQSTWVGPDAEQFRNWWPEKRAALTSMRDDLSQFGSAAIKNAKAQETISGQM